MTKCKKQNDETKQNSSQKEPQQFTIFSRSNNNTFSLTKEFVFGALADCTDLLFDVGDMFERMLPDMAEEIHDEVTFAYSCAITMCAKKFANLDFVKIEL